MYNSPIMQHIIKITCLFCFCISIHSCSTDSSRPDDALGTARAFIRFSLDGEFKPADELMLQDSLNHQELGQMEKRFQNDLSKEDKLGFRKASIIIHSVDQVNDTVVVITYSNSYKQKKMPVKIILKDGLWQVDLPYTFSGNL
jgi:hypothetical protein